MAQRTRTFVVTDNAGVFPPLVAEGQEVEFNVSVVSRDRAGNASAPVTFSTKSLGEVLPTMSSLFTYHRWWVAGNKVRGNYWWADENDAVLGVSYANAESGRFLYLMNTPKTGDDIRAFLEMVTLQGYIEFRLSDDQWFIKQIQSVDISNENYVKIGVSPVLYQGPFDNRAITASAQDISIGFSQAQAGGRGLPGVNGEDGEGYEDLFIVTNSETPPALPSDTRPYDQTPVPDDGYRDRASPVMHNNQFLWPVRRPVPGNPAVGTVPVGDGSDGFGSWFRPWGDEPAQRFGVDGIYQRFIWAATATLIAPPIVQPTDRTVDDYVPAGWTNNKEEAQRQGESFETPIIHYSYATKDGGTRLERTWSNYVNAIVWSVADLPVQSWYTIVPRHRFVEYQQWQSYTRAQGVETRLPDPPVTWVARDDGPYIPGAMFANNPTVPQKIVFNANHARVPVSADTPAGSIETGSVLFKNNVRWRDFETDAWVVNIGMPWVYGSPSENFVNWLASLDVTWEVWCVLRHYNKDLGGYLHFTTPALCGIVDRHGYLPPGGRDGQFVAKNAVNDEIWKNIEISDVAGLEARLTAIETRLAALDGGSTTPAYSRTVSGVSETGFTVTGAGGPATGNFRLRIRVSGSTGAYTYINSPSTSDAMVVTGLAAGTTYEYSITKSTGDTDWSDTWTQTTDAASSSSDSTITPYLTTASDTTAIINVAIRPRDTSITSVEYYLATSATKPVTGTPATGTVTITNGNNGNIQLSGLPSSTQHYLYVREGGYWKTDAGDFVTFTTLQGVGQVTGVVLSQRSAGGARVRFNAVSGATGYEVYASTSRTAPGSGDITGALRITGTETTLTNRRAATTHYVWVRAYYSDEVDLVYGDWSARASFNTLALGNVSGITIQGTPVTQGANRYWEWNISWTALPGAEGYNYQITPDRNSDTGAIYNSSTTGTVITVSSPTAPTYYVRVQGYSGTHTSPSWTSHALVDPS